MTEPSNIHPIFDRMVRRQEKEALQGTRGHVFWLTGLSGSGKSTLAIAAERTLYDQGLLTRLLDGDNVRTGLCSGLGFTEEDRRENIRRIAEVCRLFVDCGIPVIASFVSPASELRELAKQVIGPEDFSLIEVRASLTSCIERDPKGLYKKALAGEIPHFTGVSAPYEDPLEADLVIDTDKVSREEAAGQLLNFVLKKIKHGLSA